MRNNETYLHPSCNVLQITFIDHVTFDIQYNFFIFFVKSTNGLNSDLKINNFSKLMNLETI